MSDASFSESLYGLRRRSIKIKAMKDDAQHVTSGDGIHHSGLEKHQRVLSVVVLVRPSLSSASSSSCITFGMPEISAKLFFSFIGCATVF